MKTSKFLIIVFLSPLIFCCSPKDYFQWDLPQKTAFNPVIALKGDNKLKLSCSINSTGKDKIARFGFCINEKGSPIISDLNIFSNLGIDGTFEGLFNNLKSNNKYYVKPFVITTTNETIYGQETAITTLPACNILNLSTNNNYIIDVKDLNEEFFKAGKEIFIKISSPNNYNFGQANEISLYQNETKIYSFGTFIQLQDSYKSFTIPESIEAKNCYTIRVSKNLANYISGKFSIY